MDDELDADYRHALDRQRAWVSDRELAALGMERASGFKSVDGLPESHVDQASRMLREAAPLAASTLVRLCQNGETETVRLKAAIEILNRVQAQGTAADGREPWAEVYDQVLATTDVENFANGQ